MHHFHYVDGTLHAESVDLKALADEIGTPFYCYSSATLERHYRVFDQAFRGLDHLVCYAMKANSNQAVIKTLFDLGAGIDVVSEGELRPCPWRSACRATASCSPASARRRTRWRWRSTTALPASTWNRCPNSSFSTRWPGTRACARRCRCASTRTSMPKTHEKITTGKSENKFGIPYLEAIAAYERAASMPAIDVVGVDMHIGSQITDIEPYDKAYRLLADLIVDLRGRGFAIEHADLGGGLGVPYAHGNASAATPGRICRDDQERAGRSRREACLEPGRMIVGNAGILVARVIYVKENPARNVTFLITDAAMNDLIRPTLYDACHDICRLRSRIGRSRMRKWPTSSDRCANRAIISRGLGRCRRSRKATCSPS